MTIEPQQIDAAVRLALREDLGPGGVDVTTELALTGPRRASAKIVAKATSAASRPVPMRTSPMGMARPEGSKMYQPSPRKTST